MDLYYKQEIKVGAVVIVALAILVVGMMWLTGQTLRRGGRVTVPVEFATVSGLTVGDPVQISGVSVGRVAHMQLEELGRVIVEIEVDRRVRPRTDASAEIRSLDFLGAKYVAYTPGDAEDFLERDGTIVGGREGELASSAMRLTDQAAVLLARGQELLSERTLTQVRATLEATERAMSVVARVGSGPLAADAGSTLSSLKGAAQALDSTLSNPSINESLSQLDEIAEGVREMTEGLAAVTQNLASMLELMRSPDGTVGKMLGDSTIHTDLHEVLVSLRMLLDDVRERPGRYVNVSVF